MMDYSLLKATKQQMAVLQHEPDRLLSDTPAALQTLTAMISAANKEQEFTPLEMTLFIEATSQLKIKVGEVNAAFWKAYADPFKPNGKIQFAHLWKYIDEQRKQKEPDPRLYTYEEALAMMNKLALKELDHHAHFEMIRQPVGKPLWKKKPHMLEVRI